MTAFASTSFDTGVLVLGGLLLLGAVLAGAAQGGLLSLTAIFVIAGFVLGSGALNVLDLNPRSGFVNSLVTVALILILFRDGLEVEAEMLQHSWKLPARALVFAMPLTAIMIAGLTKLLTGMSWTESLLLGALLSPTDPVLSSAVVTNTRVPRVIRHTLNLESGLNDGLALPAVLAFAAVLDPNVHGFLWWRFVIQDVAVGLVTGLLIGILGARLMPREQVLGHKISQRQKSLYALGIAFACYGTAVADPHGNAFIAVFVCAMTLGTARPDIRAAFESRSEDLIEIVKLGVFVVFGSLLSLPRLFNDGWVAIAIVVATLTVIRPLSILVSLHGTALSRRAKAFIGWFGPKGVATMTFSLMILNRDLAAGQRIFDLAALAVLTSIIAHGLTGHPGVEWIARHTASRKPAHSSSRAGHSAVT